MKYQDITDMGRSTDELAFKDYVLKIQLMSNINRARSLAKALRNRDGYAINAHAAFFQAAPFNMSRVVSIEESDKLIDQWLEDNKDDDSVVDYATNFVGDVLTEVLD